LLPKIDAVLVLIILIVFGVGVIALASVVLFRRRQLTEARRLRDLGSRGELNEVYESDREIYEALYPKRSTTVSARPPAKRPPESR
jgi:hypothetical protein